MHILVSERPARRPTGRPAGRARTTVALLLVGAIPVMFVAILFALPVIALAVRAFGHGGGGDLLDLLDGAGAWHLVAFTVEQAALSAVVTLAVSLPIIWLVVRAGPTVRRIVMVGVTVPFVLPTVVVGMAFRALLGDGGPLSLLGLDGTIGALLCAHAFLNVAVVVRVVSAVLLSLDTRAAEAARTLGASAPRAFLTVVVPRLMPAVASAMALVFLFCSTSFGVVLILGNGRLQTIETEIYRQAVDYFDIPTAVALTLLQVVLVAAVALLTMPWRADRAVAVGRRGRRPASAATRVGLTLAAAWAVVVCLLPVAVLVVRSVRPTTGGQWTLVGYRMLTAQVNGQSAVSSLRYSLETALGAMVLSVIVGVAAAVGISRAPRVVGAFGGVLVVLPLGVSAVTVGFGYLIVLSNAPDSIATSAAVIPCVQALICIPVVYRMVAPALAAVPQNLRDSAATLGAGPLRLWWTVDLPIASRAITSAAGFAFIMAVGEFGATSFLTRPGTVTLPVLIGAALGRPGEENLAAAMAASVLLVVITGAGIAVIEMFCRDGEAGI
ncbi:ABC transporter permease [Gordonia jinhuaensis]|uniref:ABC transporter permease n=1 Tax=Gordonia jinhuaensis TaxID=1517702 RepID=A0A916WQ17_9ACTN|nr:ABC transporter permease [Gordonia jinhuaensis]